MDRESQLFTALQPMVHRELELRRRPGQPVNVEQAVDAALAAFCRHISLGEHADAVRARLLAWAAGL